MIDWKQDDPDRPLNWTLRTKWLLVSTLSATALLMPMGSYRISPAISLIMKEFDAANEVTRVSL